MPQMKRENVYRSRISVLLICIFLVIIIPIFIPIFQDLIYPGMFVMGGILLFLISFFIGMRYVISGDNLIVRIFWLFPIASVDVKRIDKVERTYDPLSSPQAVSIKKLRISFLAGSPWLISPVREEEFLEALKAVNPHIYVKISHKKGFWRIQDWDI